MGNYRNIKRYTYANLVFHRGHIVSFWDSSSRLATKTPAAPSRISSLAGTLPLAVHAPYCRLNRSHPAYRFRKHDSAMFTIAPRMIRIRERMSAG